MGVNLGVLDPLRRAVQSLYKRSESLVCIAGCKSDLFSVRIGLHQGCVLLQILFIKLMDRISSAAKEWRGSNLVVSGFHLCF